MPCDDASPGPAASGSADSADSDAARSAREGMEAAMDASCSALMPIAGRPPPSAPQAAATEPRSSLRPRLSCGRCGGVGGRRERPCRGRGGRARAGRVG